MLSNIKPIARDSLFSNLEALTIDKAQSITIDSIDSIETVSILFTMYKEAIAAIERVIGESDD